MEKLSFMLLAGSYSIKNPSRQ